MIPFALLMIALHLTPKSSADLAKHSKHAPVLLFVSHASSPFSIQVKHAWSQLQHTFENSSEIVLADLHCSKHDRACHSYSRNYPQILRYGGPLSPGSIRISPGNSYSSFLHFTESLIAVTRSCPCRSFAGNFSTFPTFVFHGPLTSGCEKVRAIAQYVPNQIDAMYYAVDDTKKTVVWLNRTESVVHRSGSEVEFVEHFSHSMLADVNFANLFSFGRTKAYLVTDNLSDCDRFRDFFRTFERQALIGRAQVMQYNEKFPRSSLKAKELPAIVLERPRLPVVAFRNVNSENLKQLESVRNAMNEKYDPAIRQIRDAFVWKKSPPPELRKGRFLFSFGLSILTIAATVAAIVHNAYQCIHHTNRSTAPVFPVV
jgi:hypothetical protein